MYREQYGEYAWCEGVKDFLRSLKAHSARAATIRFLVIPWLRPVNQTRHSVSFRVILILCESFQPQYRHLIFCYVFLSSWPEILMSCAWSFCGSRAELPNLLYFETQVLVRLKATTLGFSDGSCCCHSFSLEENNRSHFCAFMKWAKVSGENWSEQVEWEARWKERVSGFSHSPFPNLQKQKSKNRKKVTLEMPTSMPNAPEPI